MNKKTPPTLFQYNFKIIVDQIVVIIRMNKYDVVALRHDQQEVGKK